MPAACSAARRGYTGDTKAESATITHPCSPGLGMGSYAISHQKKLSHEPLVHQETSENRKATVETGEKRGFFVLASWTHTSAFPVHARPRTGRLCPLPCIAGQRACTEI